MDKVSDPYPQLFEAYAQLASERGPEAPRALLRDNALRFYGILTGDHRAMLTRWSATIERCSPAPKMTLTAASWRG